MNERWRLEELVQLAGQALNAAPYEGQTSGRVRDVPDARTIRYYTTIGILDRPVEMRGRTAYYGRRHLLQIVAVKRLQARGMSLVDIQKNVSGADNSSLKRWAALPAGFWETATIRLARRAVPTSPDEVLKSADSGTAVGSAPVSGAAPAAEARARFWAAEPALASREDRAVPAIAVAAKPAVVLPLASGVTLIIAGQSGKQPEPAALNAIRPALDGLLAALAEAGLVGQARISEEASINEEDFRDLGPRQTTTNPPNHHEPRR